MLFIVTCFITAVNIMYYSSYYSRTALLSYIDCWYGKNCTIKRLNLTAGIRHIFCLPSNYLFYVIINLFFLHETSSYDNSNNNFTTSCSSGYTTFLENVVFSSILPIKTHTLHTNIVFLWNALCLHYSLICYIILNHLQRKSHCGNIIS